MDKYLVAVGALTAIGGTIWWFFRKREVHEVAATVSNDTQSAEVTVNGGYTPNIITLEKDRPAVITFHRKDPSGCFSHVVFPDFGINEALLVGEKHDIAIDTSNAGEYTYACGMNMFHGKIIIK